MRFSLSRRDILSSGVVSAVSLALPGAAHAMMRPANPGIKIGVAAPWNPTKQDLKFFKQIGFDHVYSNYTPGPGGANVPSVDDLKTRKQIWADAGLNLHNIRWFSGSPTTGSMDLAAILLGLPGRDESMERCRTFIRNYGAAGFGYTISTLSVTGVWYSGWGHIGDAPGTVAPETRGATTRLYDEADWKTLRATTQPKGTPPGADTLTYGRVYDANEVTANYRKFCDEIRPLLEDSGVCIGFHPDDPPTYKSFGGIARINGTFDQIQRNIDIGNSPNLGITFCLGVWLEGGAKMGMDPIAAVKKYIAQKKVFSINFRNVTATLPKFTESWMDNGYYDMYPFMKALVEAGYDQFLEQDHTMNIEGAPDTYDAFASGYERALWQRAVREVGKS